jgi:HYR domain
MLFNFIQIIARIIALAKATWLPYTARLCDSVMLVVLIGCLYSLPVNAQLPWTENFSNNGGQGVRGGCGAAPTSCSTYSAPTEGTLSGNYSGLNNNNDWFRIYDLGAPYGFGLEARDVENEVCYTTNTITLGSPTNITLEVDLVESGNLESSDYIRVSRIIDGVETVVQTVSDDFNTTTVTATNIPVVSTIATKICFDTDENNEYLAAYEIRITAVCSAPPVANCQNTTVTLSGLGTATITPAAIDNGSTAPCGLDYMTLSQTTFDCSDIGTNPVTLTVFDDNGSSASCNATVTVYGAGTSGNWIPSITSCPSNISTNTDPGINTALVNYTLPTASNTVTGFNYDYELCQWTLVEEADGYITSNAPVSIILNSADDGTWHAETKMEITIPCDVSISFDWNYTSDDAYGQAGWDPFGYILNGTFVQLMDGVVVDTSSTATGAAIQNGSETINLSEGDVFALTQRTVDGIYGRGHTRISNFVAVEATNINLTSGLASGSNFPIGTTTVTYVASDCEGNSASCSFDVEVISLEVSCEQVIINRHIGFRTRN